MCTCIRCLGLGTQLTDRGPWPRTLETCELCHGNGVLSYVDPDCAAVIERLYPTQVVEAQRYVCSECGAPIYPTGRMGAPCPGCGRAGTGREVEARRVAAEREG
jgi:predicted RNA-binding Zn-ribbon protein involved in translation (DUF1610 family)